MATIQNKSTVQNTAGFHYHTGFILPLSQQMALVCHFIGLMFGGCDLLSVENPIGICQDCLYFD